jgi:cell fate regulator YaaT (PSP1 superfamily)
MRYDPHLAAVNLAAQLIVYHNHTWEELERLTDVVPEYTEEVEAEVERLRTKLRDASTAVHVRFSTRELEVRKIAGLCT